MPALLDCGAAERYPLGCIIGIVIRLSFEFSIWLPTLVSVGVFAAVAAMRRRQGKSVTVAYFSAWTVSAILLFLAFSRNEDRFEASLINVLAWTVISGLPATVAFLVMRSLPHLSLRRQTLLATALGVLTALSLPVVGSVVAIMAYP